MKSKSLLFALLLALLMPWATQTLVAENGPSAAFSFRTDCEAITIGETPWTENFEDFYYEHETHAPAYWDYKSYMLNVGCWDINYGDYVNPVLYAGYKPAAFSGYNSVQFENRFGSATLILPEFANELNTLQFEFKACVYLPEWEGTMEVGYWYDGEFTALHTGIQTQTARGKNDITNASGDYMGPYPLYGTIPSGSRIALHYDINPAPGNTGCINLDDFRVSLIPPCDEPPTLPQATSLPTPLPLAGLKTAPQPHGKSALTMMKKTSS